MYEDISSVQGGRLSLYTYTIWFDFLQFLFFSYIQCLYVNIYTRLFSLNFFIDLEILLMGLGDYLVTLMAHLGGLSGMNVAQFER